jgi:hypothetical protein
VELAILERSIRGNELVRVYAKASNPAYTSRNTPRAKKVQQSVGTLGMVHMEVPELKE